MLRSGGNNYALDWTMLVDQPELRSSDAHVALTRRGVLRPVAMRANGLVRNTIDCRADM